MKKQTGKEEFHNTYPEYNEASEGMIKHKARSGASAAAIHLLQSVALIPATLMGGLVVGLVLMSMVIPRVSSLMPQLISHTHNSAVIQVDSDDVTYPLHYELRKVEGEVPPSLREGVMPSPEETLLELSAPVYEGQI